MAIIKEHFVPVAVDANVLNIVQDADGKFIRDSGIDFFASSGGVRFVTANGKQLAKGRQHGVDRAALDEALAAWSQLPEDERRPGAISIGDRGPIDAEHATAEPPANGLILKLYGRYLARAAWSGLRTTTLKDFPGIMLIAAAQPGQFDFYGEANPDYMWLTEAEWKALLPAEPKKGDRYPAPDAIIDRLCRYHLLPDAMGAQTSDAWRSVGPKETNGIRAKEMTLTIDEVSPTTIGLTLDGLVHLGNEYDPQAASRENPNNFGSAAGFEARLRGILNYDRARQAFTRFDMIALGDMYGEESAGPWLVRPGRNPVGFAFELISGDGPGDRLPPRGYMTRRDLAAYLGSQ